MAEHEPLTASPAAADDVAVARALTVFEHAVRRHAAAQTELRVERRASTSKAALKTAHDLAQARAALTGQLARLGWQPPADVSLTDAPLIDVWRTDVSLADVSLADVSLADADVTAPPSGD